MKQTSFAERTSSKAASTSAGSSGVAIAPPAYGIDVVDRESTEVTPEHGHNHQTLALGVRPASGATIQKHAFVCGAEGGTSTIRQAKKTGLPDNLKAGIENLSGLSLDDVKVHYNSPKPMHVQALAYTQGTDIHIAPGQERHVPHEAWHVVQQKQGRVKPTMQAKGAAINDDQALENEADVMGDKALRSDLQTSFLRKSAFPAFFPRRYSHAPNEDNLFAPIVQRFELPEHRALGDEALTELLDFLQTPDGVTWIGGEDKRDELVARIQEDREYFSLRGGRISLRDGLSLTPGEIIGLHGDFYGSWRALARAPREEVEGILRVGEQQRRGTINATNANRVFERITGGRYLNLAQRNLPHFTPGNRDEWLELHQEALHVAQQAESTDDEFFQRALFIDAAGGHFLTDAFSSGHLFDTPRILAEINTYIASHPPQAQNPEMQAYIGAAQLSCKIAKLVLKNIHDHFNQVGFEVNNRRGMIWRAFGDDYLRTSEETRHIAALAVFESRNQVFQVRAGGSPDPNSILELLPDTDSVDRATNQAIAYIQTAVSKISDLIYRQRGMAPVMFGSILGSIAESNLATIARPGRARELEELERRSDTLGGGPLLAPQFTIFEF